MATQVQTLDKDAFDILVLENDLRSWQQGGYRYAGKRGVNGWELYRCASVIDWDSLPTLSRSGPNPAISAASVLIGTVPTGKRWKPIALMEQYVRDANAADVYAMIGFSESDGFVVGRAALTNPMTASHTWQLFFMLGQPQLTFNDGAIWYTMGTMPDLELRAGGTITLYWANDTAGDDGAAPQLTYKEADTP